MAEYFICNSALGINIINVQHAVRRVAEETEAVLYIQISFKDAVQQEWPKESLPLMWPILRKKGLLLQGAVKSFTLKEILLSTLLEAGQ